MKTINPTLLYQKVSKRIDDDIDKNNLAGAVALVYQNGEPVLRLYKGYKNPFTKESMTPHTLFRLASLTKPITGAACMIANELGWLDINDPVYKYFPEVKDMYVGKIENGHVVPDYKPKKDICIYNLLTHTSGIMASTPIGALQEAVMPREAFQSNQAMVEYCLNHTYLTLNPDKEAAYSAYAAFDLIALIIERNSGMSYADFLTENLFSPLGISNITFLPNENQWSKMSVMCDRADGAELIAVDMGKHTFERFPLSYTCAGASLTGTPEDYLIFGEMLRRGGEYNGKRILTEDSVKILRTPHIDTSLPGMGPENSWGLGVRVATDKNVLPSGSYGWSGAYGPHFWVDPENNITAIFMKNMRWHDSHGCGNTGINFEKDVMQSLT